jgi:hypothetical protein
MRSPFHGLWLSLVYLLQLLGRVDATIDITFPTDGWNYTAAPYKVQWTSTRCVSHPSLELDPRD